jgi:REP element-mobilizing transposase RayT
MCRIRLHAYLGEVSRRLGCPSILAGGTEDHIHQLIRLGRTITQADWVKEIKRASSLWVKRIEPRFRNFTWQAGYGFFSVSPSDRDAVRQYIACQEEHHRKITFQDEFRAMLKRYGLEWDERFVWD